MTGHSTTILGGLPVWAECSWWQDYYGECDGEVSGLFWLKRDGTKGTPLSQKIMDRLEKTNPYWQADVLENVSEQLAYEAYMENSE